jgi:hypothetical protein
MRMYLSYKLPNSDLRLPVRVNVGGIDGIDAHIPRGFHQLETLSKEELDHVDNMFSR